MHKAENFHQQSLDDSSFSVFNIHGASELGGAFLVIVVLVLAAIGYCMARYMHYARKCQVQALISLETTLKPSCPA